MIVLLPVLMAYSLVGETVHEWLGAAMILLFLAHHALNLRWYQGLAKGRWMAARMLQTAVNITLLACMLVLMASGIALARNIPFRPPVSGGQALARTAHMLGSYWGFCLMSLHLGFHWSMVLGMARKRFGQCSKAGARLLRGLALAAAAYGLMAFFRRAIPDYLFLRIHFVFFDFEEPLVLFFLDYLSIMELFTVLGYYLTKRTAKQAA